jgi:6-phosphogluconolactonase
VADLHLSPDNRFLYVSNRGSNTLAIFNVSNDGKKLKLIDFEPVHGNWPRNFALTPDGRYLLVANQKSNNLSLFLRDNLTGKLKFISKIKAASPVFILFYSN